MNAVNLRSVRQWTLILLITVLCLGSGIREGHAQTAPQAVVLNDVPPGEGVAGGILIRELVRQALLITARDEFGLLTRDATLGEVLPDGSPLATPPFEIFVDAGAEDLAKIRIVRQQGDEQVELSAFELKYEFENSISSISTQMEEMSRKQLVDVLEKAGFKRPVPAKQEGAKAAAEQISEELAKQLKQFNPISQFAAVRALHSEIRTSGESAPLLAALATAYANLGTLTEVHWSPAHKVFKARALLYARRLASKYTGKQALATAAYVHAMVGLLFQAQTNVSDLDRIGAQQVPPETRTPLHDLIDAYCVGDTRRLQAAADDGEHKLLARYFQMLIAEYGGVQVLQQKAAESVLQLDPANMRAMEVLILNAPLGLKRNVALSAPQRFVTSLPSYVAGIADLPPALQKVAKSTPEDGNDVISQLTDLMNGLIDPSELENSEDQRQEGADPKNAPQKNATQKDSPWEDTQEPSLMVAGHLIRETNFVHAFRLLSLQRFSLSVNADPTLRQVLPLIAGHRYQEFLEAHQSDPDAAGAALVAIAETTDNPHLEAAEEPMFALMKQLNVPNWNKLQGESIAHNDVLVRDLIDTAARSRSQVERTAAAATLQAIAPESPAIVATLIAHHWDAVADLAEGWEKQYTDDALVQEMLGIRYANLGKQADAERCFKRRLELRPDFVTYKRLGDMQLAKNDRDAWVKTMTEALKLEDSGLQGAQIRVQIANHFIQMKDLKSACKYADEAAETGAEWALRSAAMCHELNGEFEDAEKYVRAISERYPMKELDWYFWCRCTAQGDVTEARKEAKKVAAQYAESENAYQRRRAALFLYSEEKDDEALEIMQDVFEKDHDPAHGFHAALLADELGKTELRDELLERCQQHAYAQGNIFGAILLDFRNSLRAEGAIPVDVKVQEMRIHIQPEGEVTRLYYCLGKFLLLHGREEEGLRYLQRAATSPVGHREGHIWAGVTLARRQVPREKFQSTEWSFDEHLESILYRVVLAYQAAARGNLDAADGLADQVVSADANSIDAVLLRARIKQARKQFDLAITAFKRCKELVPNSTDLNFSLAACYEATGDYKAAIAEYEEAIKTNPYQGNGFKALAHLLSTCEDDKIRDGKKAVEYAQQMLTLKDNIPEAQKLVVLAMALAEAGDFDEAVKNAELALTKLPPQFQGEVKPLLELFRDKKPYRRTARP